MLLEEIRKENLSIKSAGSFFQIYESLLLTRDDSLDSMIENLTLLLIRAKEIKNYSASMLNGDYV